MLSIAMEYSPTQYYYYYYMYSVYIHDE